MNKFNPKDFLHSVVVIDASVFVKLFLEEEGSDLVDQLVNQHLEYQTTLMATPLLKYELLNVLSNKLKDVRTVEEAWGKFEEIGIAVIEPADKHISSAIEATCENSPISYYDAAYHALAKDMGGTFLTADRRYFDLMKKEGNIALFG